MIHHSDTKRRDPQRDPRDPQRDPSREPTNPKIPIAHSPHSQSDQVPAQTRTQAREQPPRVLVIDDAEVSRLAIVDVLSQAGCQVFQLASAIGATRSIIRQNINAAVIDINMPGLSGDKLVSVLRDNPRLRGLKIIVVSSRSADELEAIRAACGADGAVDKGAVATELWPLLSRLLGTSRALSP